jgi:hypothetical protein
MADNAAVALSPEELLRRFPLPPGPALCAQNRRRLVDGHVRGGALLLEAGGLVPRNGDVYHKYRAESSFAWAVAPLAEPDFAALIDGESGAPPPAAACSLASFARFYLAHASLARTARAFINPVGAAHSLKLSRRPLHAAGAQAARGGGLLDGAAAVAGRAGRGARRGRRRLSGGSAGAAEAAPRGPGAARVAVSGGIARAGGGGAGGASAGAAPPPASAAAAVAAATAIAARSPAAILTLCERHL